MKKKKRLKDDSYLKRCNGSNENQWRCKKAALELILVVDRGYGYGGVG